MMMMMMINVDRLHPMRGPLGMSGLRKERLESNNREK
jgi:hypothetical protein